MDWKRMGQVEEWVEVDVKVQVEVDAAWWPGADKSLVITQGDLST